MIRPREFTTRDIIGKLPEEQRARFLALDPAERQLLINGTEEEREQYGWLPGAAATRFAKLPENQRRAEARASWTARRVTRKAPLFPSTAPAPASPLRPVASPDAARASWRPSVPDLCDTSARIAETARDIFDLPAASFERVQSLALNLLQTGSDESETLDRVAAMVIGETPLPACEPPPSRMQVRLGAGGFIRG